MNTFHDLFRQPTRRVGSAFPSDRRRELFPGFVERSPKLHLWTAGQPVPEHGPRLLIGVATWSGYDLNLLDLVEEAPASPVRVDVFDIDSCLDPAILDRYVPGAVAPVQPPLVGYWNDGRLVEWAAGHLGHQLVVRVCNLPPQDVETRMRSILARN
ncbi:MAG: hypothetical protein K2P78_02125 [Gemmataceae bacterium]|nr:hypothetical protein [Gemmataceae bacterium]